MFKSIKTIVTTFGLLLLASFPLTAQSTGDAPGSKETAAVGTKPPTVSSDTLEVKSTIHVANLFAAELNAPAVCGQDGRLYASIFVVRPNAPPSHLLSQNIVGIDRDGRVSLNVAVDAITDVQGARLISFFPGEHEIDLLIRAPEEGDSGQAKPRQGGVETLFQKSDREREFIAHFDRDGTYRGSTRIDIPISGLQFGLLPTGQFVIAGIDELNRARVVLVKASGQMDRYVELKDANSNDPSTTSRPESSKEAGLFAAAFSRMIADGQDVLLTSPDSSSAFKINTAGEAQEIRLRGANANILQAAPDGWLTEASDAKHGVSLRLYSRRDATLVNDYVFADKGEFVFGCMREQEFTFLRKDSDGRLLLFVTARANKESASPGAATR